MRKTISTDRAPRPSSPISQGYRVGDFIFVSGQGPRDPRTRELRGDSIEEQTKHTLENVTAILEAGGASLADVVKATVILANVADFQAMNSVFQEYFSEPFPTRICYGGHLISPGMLVEIEAIAYVGD